jgi:translation initiation factor 2 subunit 3
MDGAMLLVAANSKVPQPQTKEHLLALETLGIKQIVIVQNKVDLISYENALKNHSEISKFLKGTSAKNSPIIPICAQSSLNIDALIGAIEETIETPTRDESKNAVMHVLRSFDINKPGTEIKNLKGGVIGGSLVQGKFSLGDEIEIKPGIFNDKKKSYQSIRTEIVSLGTGAGIVDNAQPGGLVAIGTKLDPSLSKSDSLIGSVIGKPGTLPENSVDAKLKISLFDNAVGSTGETKIKPIQVDELLRVNIGTAPVPAKVKKVKSDDIEIKFKRPVCLFNGVNVALSRRITDRWRLIGAGVVG